MDLGARETRREGVGRVTFDPHNAAALDVSEQRAIHRQ
jgi:hypothetical protein